MNTADVRFYFGAVPAATLDAHNIEWFPDSHWLSWPAVQWLMSPFFQWIMRILPETPAWWFPSAPFPVFSFEARPAFASRRKTQE